MFHCRTCFDVEWVAVDIPRNVVKPCPACNQTMYTRWSSGELSSEFRRREQPDTSDAHDGLAGCREALAAVIPMRRGES